MSTKSSKNSKSITYIANLLASILLYYPEIATINLDSQACIVRFTFYLDKIIPRKQLNHFRKELESSLNAYYYLEQQEVNMIDIQWQALDSMTALEITRDVQTISKKEIVLLIAILKNEFGDDLVTDEDEELEVDDLSVHEELIGYMLENANKTSTRINLVAMRDEGKVLVYNK